VIHGQTTCTASFPPSCSPTGSDIGVDAVGRKKTVVRNGQVFAMGFEGIRVGESGRVEQVMVAGNGGDGLVVGGLNGIVTGVQAKGNGGAGIIANGTVTTNTADGNGGTGISASGLVLNNEAVANHSFGLNLSFESGYAGNVLNNNNGGNGKPQVF